MSTILVYQYCDRQVQEIPINNVKKLVRRAAVLPLITIRQVKDIWFVALEENDDFSPEMTRFTDYVTETWVEGQLLELWNHFDNDRARTTMHVEGCHSKVNKLCQHAHPNIFATFKMLQKILSPLKQRFNDNELSLIDYADAASHLIHLD